MKLRENQGVDLSTVHQSLLDHHMGLISKAYRDLWDTISQDISAPGACMHRDELFEICSDRLFNMGLPEKTSNWWRSMTPEQRGMFLAEIFPQEYYEVGDNSGFGEDGVMS